MLVFAAAALAYPPLTIRDVTQDSMTLGSLDCGTQYRVQVEERDASGAWTAPTTQTATTSDCPASAPVAEFSISPDPAVRTRATTFTSTGTCAATPCTYEWLHGDAASTDAIGTGTSASFTYTGPVGPRTVTLRVTDSQDREAVRTRTFQLVEPTATPTPTPTATATATPTPTATPDPPTGDFPDESNTGVPPGTTLTPSGPITVNTAGAVINAVEAPYIIVNAPNVTIRNSRIRSGAVYLIESRSTGLVVEDTELDGQMNGFTGVSSGGFTLRRVEITGTENALDIGGRGNVTMVDSYIHDLNTAGDNHTDGIQIGQGASNLIIRGNNISPQDTGNPASTSAIIMYTGGGTQNSRVWIENNRLDGGRAAFALYAPRNPATDIYINNNRMVRGVYGYADSVSVPSRVTEFNGNVDDVTGAPIRAGN
jgi:hypothetical protein